MENKVDPVAAECARQDKEAVHACFAVNPMEIGHSGLVEIIRMLSVNLGKRGKLIAAYELERQAMERCQDSGELHPAETSDAWVEAYRELEAAIAEFAAGEGA